MAKAKRTNQDGTVSVMFRASRMWGPFVVFPTEPHEGAMRGFVPNHRDRTQAITAAILRASEPAPDTEWVLRKLAQEFPLIKPRVVQRITAEMREVFNTRLREG